MISAERSCMRYPSPAVTWEGCMQNGSQVVHAVSFEESLLRSDSAHRPQALIAVQRPSVLLVGRNESLASRLFKMLERLGADAAFTSPPRATSECIQNGCYKLVLLDSCVPSEQRKRLVGDLSGSQTSLFYVYPVERGCWWLPALRFGEDCHGAPAFRSHEFLRELDRLLQDTASAEIDQAVYNGY